MMPDGEQDGAADRRLGGYQVLKEKWLSYRERAILGRPSSPTKCNTSPTPPAASPPCSNVDDSLLILAAAHCRFRKADGCFGRLYGFFHISLVYGHDAVLAIQTNSGKTHDGHQANVQHDPGV